MILYGGLFDSSSNRDKLAKLKEEMGDPNFWGNKRESERVISEYNSLNNLFSSCKKLKSDIDFYVSNIDDPDVISLARDEIGSISSSLRDLEISILFDGKYDNNDAILEIHAGAGGTEACDWTSMLYRMYMRWCEKHNFKVKVIDETLGTDAGIKSISVIVSGLRAYGYLSSEKGIHRLVRISPFDSNKRRHTSFAAVDVTPVFDNSIDIKIDEKDIRVDVFRSTGAGGQGVNTTDSAVRVTHIPTGIVVTCQNERSQIQNKEMCMQILKSKLYDLERLKKEEELNKIKGNLKKIDFGSQIRSYIMQPYTLVKDHRTGYEDNNVNRVLDGDIDGFIYAYLKDR